jgi:hypothetical protein
MYRTLWSLKQGETEKELESMKEVGEAEKEQKAWESTRVEEVGVARILLLSMRRCGRIRRVIKYLEFYKNMKYLSWHPETAF